MRARIDQLDFDSSDVTTLLQAGDEIDKLGLIVRRQFTPSADTDAPSAWKGNDIKAMRFVEQTVAGLKAR